MANNPVAVDPAVQDSFNNLLSRHPDVEAILLSTADGVPLIRALRSSNTSQDPLPVESLETKLAAIFSIAADQARKMKQGSCKSITALYQGLSLVHINISPLVMTFASREGSANVGMILDSQPLYEEALAPLRAEIELQEKEAGSRSY